MRYYIWLDESVKKGSYFSDFYGGVLVESSQYEGIRKALTEQAQALNLGTELKWTKINAYQLEGYLEIMTLFFQYIQANEVKVRIMFTQNAFKQVNLSEYQKAHAYHLLYYQFVKHAFGLKYLNPKTPNFIEFFFDEIPDTQQKNELFKNHVFSLQRIPDFQKANIRIELDAIAEVDSKQHILLQCLDVVLGAMAFRLNKMHLQKPPNAKNRGKRTLAKEKVYKHILQKIKEVYPNFNIGITTGTQGNLANLWEHPYRHWRFLPYQWEKVDESSLE